MIVFLMNLRDLLQGDCVLQFVESGRPLACSKLAVQNFFGREEVLNSGSRFKTNSSFEQVLHAIQNLD
jgi:hypothetical protein